MSIGAELLVRDIVDTMQDTVVISEFGDGCPLLDEAENPPVRFARRPVGGLVRRNGVATFAPPLNIQGRADDCVRLLRTAPQIVDALAVNAADLLASVQELTSNTPAVLRVRGQGFTEHAMELIYEDPASADYVYLRRDLTTDGLIARANALTVAEVDEFDALTAAIGPGGVIAYIRHGAGLSEAVLNPAAILDQPSDDQITVALAEGRAVMAADDRCALFVPQLSGRALPVSIRLGGLEAAAPDPAISFPNARAWAVKTTRDGANWRAVASPAPGAAPLVSVFLEVEAPGSPAAEITEVTTAITRKRGQWEIWDEAQQRLELEESW